MHCVILMIFYCNLNNHVHMNKQSNATFNVHTNTVFNTKSQATYEHTNDCTTVMQNVGATLRSFMRGKVELDSR